MPCLRHRAYNQFACDVVANGQTALRNLGNRNALQIKIRVATFLRFIGDIGRVLGGTLSMRAAFRRRPEH